VIQVVLQCLATGMVRLHDGQWLGVGRNTVVTFVPSLSDFRARLLDLGVRDIRLTLPDAPERAIPLTADLILDTGGRRELERPKDPGEGSGVPPSSG